ncbi:NTP pyrophosphohydrolase [Streptomyces sp. ACA25]|uniref:NTP pyrophosphohydrolase n=1 Tax=Streptomyces sp. ACA25 TaxID=3022596 RepID=UPI0023081013|nr:NTP pyrophosphohydrolase [Streptomyces sp. ACA25]MDB1089152.1 NTP pyrophosphohydrolase [Streptomyces sp. ACA25]
MTGSTERPAPAPGRTTSGGEQGGEPLPLIVVDSANVVGSVPDGWWRDRHGATERLRDRLTARTDAGLPGVPGPVEIVLVVEGAAREVRPVPGVRVEAAARTGDDRIVELVEAEGAGRRCVVVTADRALRERVAALEAECAGPRSVRDVP